ncbi:MAG: hypothetical protein FD169_342 [Bacillota bacterium]|nr:MAG: hypothetical protein FD169_342 [Bacillota bacterium]
MNLDCNIINELHPISRTVVAHFGTQYSHKEEGYPQQNAELYKIALNPFIKPWRGLLVSAWVIQWISRSLPCQYP